MQTRVMALITILSLTAATASARTLYVSKDATEGSGEDFTTIQAAIDAAADNDTEIIVATGTYDEHIDFKGKNIYLHSTNPNLGAVIDNTIIRGSDTLKPTVKFSGSETNECFLAGFTIRRMGLDPWINGAGIQGNGADAAIQNCVIRNCRTNLSGGGLGGLDGLISGCLVMDNWAGIHGGGMYQCAGDTRNTVFVGNSVRDGFGGGAYDCGDIRNCVFYMNEAPYTDGGGLSNCDGDIRNCIIWGNGAPLGFFPQIRSSSTPSYSCISDWPLGSGTGNAAVDPSFMDTSIRDFRLQGDSYWIDKGDPAVAWNDACFGPQSGLGGARNDVGAYGGPLNCMKVGPDPTPSTIRDFLLTGEGYGTTMDLNADGFVDVADLIHLIVNGN